MTGFEGNVIAKNHCIEMESDSRVMLRLVLGKVTGRDITSGISQIRADKAVDAYILEASMMVKFALESDMK